MIEYAPEKKSNATYFVFFAPFLIPVAIGLWYLWTYFQVHSNYSVPVPGNPHAFDAVTSFAEVQQFAGNDTRFQGLEADYVSSNGTLDFEAGYNPAPHVTYTFHQLTNAPKDAPPIGAGGSINGKWMHTIDISLGKKGRYSEVGDPSNKQIDSSFDSRGMDKDIGYPQPDDQEPAIAPPTCRFEDLWKVALTQKAPKEAVARITYDKDGYDFSISSSDIDLTFDVNCKLVRGYNGSIEPLPPHMQ